MLTTEQCEARVSQARALALDIAADVTTNSVEVSISSKTAKELGFDALQCTEDTKLFRKVKNGSMLDGYYVYNSNCPQASSLQEAEEIAKVLMPNAKDGLLSVVNAKFKTEFQNKVRACLNAPVESKKAIKESTLLEAAEKLATGAITFEEYSSILSSTL